VGVIDPVNCFCYSRNAGLVLDADLTLALERKARRLALALKCRARRHAFWSWNMTLRFVFWRNNLAFVLAQRPITLVLMMINSC